jgi:5-methylcytosine-specific restriction protein A
VLVRDGSGRCDQHKRVEARALDARRGSSSERGYSYKWQQAREGFLRAHPLCVRHEARGEVVAATVVDHITPHKGDKALFWQRANWQPLCKRCHDIKTMTEDRGAWSPRVSDLSRVIDVQARVVDDPAWTKLPER